MLRYGVRLSAEGSGAMARTVATSKTVNALLRTPCARLASSAVGVHEQAADSSARSLTFQTHPILDQTAALGARPGPDKIHV